MKKTRVELLEERAAAREKRSGIMAAAEKESRKLTPEEIETMEECRSVISMVDARIEELDEERRTKEGAFRAGTVKVLGAPKCKTPLLRAMRDLADRKISESTQELLDRGREDTIHAGRQEAQYNIPWLSESRHLLQVTDSDANGKAVVGRERSLLDVIREQSVLSAAGAQFLTSVIGDVEFVKYSGSTADWGGEAGQAKDGAGTFSMVKFTPKRLSSYIDVTRQMLVQDSLDVENMLRRDLVAGIETKLEETIFGTAAAGVTPAGLFNGTVSNKGEASHNRLVDMMVTLKKQLISKGRFAFITSPAGAGILSKTLLPGIVPGGFLARDGETATGIPLLETTAVPDTVNGTESGLVLADWSDFVVAQWGALDFVVDPYTKAANGTVRFTVNSYWDFGFRRSESYTVASIKAPAGKPA